MHEGLRRSRRRPFSGDHDVNPMDSVLNIADLMLVFACGLMLALSVYWNVQLGPVRDRVDVTQGQQLTEDFTMRDDLIESENTGQVYERIGTVYKDPSTGQLFMLPDGARGEARTP